MTLDKSFKANSPEMDDEIIPARYRPVSSADQVRLLRLRSKAPMIAGMLSRKENVKASCWLIF